MRLNYETVRVQSTFVTATADQESLSPACSHPIDQEQVLPSGVVSTISKSTAPNTSGIKNGHSKRQKGLLSSMLSI